MGEEYTVTDGPTDTATLCWRDICRTRYQRRIVADTGDLSVRCGGPTRSATVLSTITERERLLHKIQNATYYRIALVLYQLNYVKQNAPKIIILNEKKNCINSTVYKSTSYSISSFGLLQIFWVYVLNEQIKERKTVNLLLVWCMLETRKYADLPGLLYNITSFFNRTFF